jgi:N-acetylglucosaminyldiphosphoundecaprenol N-acetyl-beta-D-mannosaminyltransferase
LIGVGAAFDFHAGAVARAPRWMQKSGLEWVHRLLSEPTRLWRRYLLLAPLFLAKLIEEQVKLGLSKARTKAASDINVGKST